MQEEYGGCRKNSTRSHRSRYSSQRIKNRGRGHISLRAVTAHYGLGGSATELVTRTDEQLYEAKSCGHNRVKTVVKLD